MPKVRHYALVVADSYPPCTHVEWRVVCDERLALIYPSTNLLRHVRPVVEDQLVLPAVDAGRPQLARLELVMQRAPGVTPLHRPDYHSLAAEENTAK